MTKEEAKKAAEVMLAYADGKTIECFVDNSIGWVEGSESPKFNWDDFDYRVKGTPNYRPFKDAEECWSEMQKHQPFCWIRRKYCEIMEIIISIEDIEKEITTASISYTFEEALKQITFIDGTPFGIKEE